VHANKYANTNELNANTIVGEFLGDAGKKTFFGFSFYELAEGISPRRFTEKVKGLGMAVKEQLKEAGRSARLVVMKEGNALSSVVVKKNKLLSQGAEVVIFLTERGIYLGRTERVQEFEEYGFRDFGRPSRDIISGTMPPKLAKMMINLAGIGFDGTLLDPFCGSGTVLGEAGLMGYGNMIGADISAKAIEDTKRNMEWMGKNFQFSITNFQLFNTDIKKLVDKLAPSSVDAIVTEPYLGPPQKSNAGRGEMERVAKDLSKLYLETFRVFKAILKPQARVVVIFPAFHPQGEEWVIYLPILEEIKSLGFSLVNPLPEALKSDQEIRMTERGSIIFSRPDQRVLREIFVWEKK